MKLFYLPWLVIGKSSYEGAQTTIHCAVDDDIPKFHGCYFRFLFKKYPNSKLDVLFEYFLIVIVNLLSHLALLRIKKMLKNFGKLVQKWSNSNKY